MRSSWVLRRLLATAARCLRNNATSPLKALPAEKPASCAGPLKPGLEAGALTFHIARYPLLAPHPRSLRLAPENQLKGMPGLHSTAQDPGLFLYVNCGFLLRFLLPPRQAMLVFWE